MNAFTKLLNESHDPRTVEKLMRKVSRLLTVGEEVERIVVQRRLLFNGFPDYLVLTYKRIVFCRVLEFGLRFELQEYQWEEVVESSLKESLLGAKLRIKTAQATARMAYLPLNAARALYQFVQAKEKETREYAHQPNSDDVQPGAGQAMDAPRPGSAPERVAGDTSLKMNQLEKMLEYRLINQNEYDERRDAMLPVG